MRGWGALLWAWSALALAQPVDVTITRPDGLTTIHHGQAKKAPASKGGAVTVEGVLEAAHMDYPPGQPSQWLFAVRDSRGKRTALNIDTLPEETHNARVRVKGKANGKSREAPAQDAVDPASVQILSEAPPLSLQANVSLLVAQVQYAGVNANPFPVSSANAVLNDVANFYAKNSYGKESMTYVYTGLVTIPGTFSGTCDWQGIMSKAPAALKAANPSWDTARFTYTIYLMPQGCGWLGLGYVGSGPSFIAAGSFVRQVVAHENGHNHGLLHAGSVPAPGGGVSEYGDRYDTMGNYQASGHFNARQKLTLGYIPTSAVKTIAAGTAGSFDITPIEQVGPLYAVKITTSDASVTYWVEDRTPTDYDAATVSSEVLQVRTGAPFRSSTGSDDTQLITNAGSGGNLAPGASYADTVANLTLNVGGGTPPPPPPPSGPVQNASFEQPATSSYVYRPTDPSGAWTFTGGAGVEKNGSAWQAANAPDGSQAAFLQNTAAVTQTVTLKAGSYTLTFRAAKRNCCTSPYLNPIKVTFDGVQVGQLVQPSSAASFDSVTLSLTVGADGTHTLSFSTANTTGDMSSFIDAVSIQ